MKFKNYSEKELKLMNKKSIFILLLIIISIMIITCNSNKNQDEIAKLNKYIDEALKDLDSLKKKFDKNPNDLKLRVSTSEAYQRLGEYYYEQMAYTHDIDLSDIEYIGDNPYIKDYEKTLNTSLDYFKEASKILEDDQLVYSFENNSSRKLKIYHKDPKIQEIYKKIKYHTSNGSVDDSLFTEEELKLKWEWDQRINKILHCKLGENYRALIPIYLAYRRTAEKKENEKIEVQKWYKKAIEYCIMAEKEYKIAIALDDNNNKYKKAHINLAKLYLYMYEQFQLATDEKASLILAQLTNDNVLANIDSDDLDALFIQARIYYYLGQYNNALNVYEKKILKNNLVIQGTKEYDFVKDNISQLKKKIDSLQQ